MLPCSPVVSSGWSFVSAVPGQMTYPVASSTLDSARSDMIRGTPFTQGTVSSIPIGGSISPEVFLPSILLVVVWILKKWTKIKAKRTKPSTGMKRTRDFESDDFCCSKGCLKDKILVPKPPQNCATCGNPVDGLYCRSCAFVRKCLNEGWYTIHDENEIINTSDSSKHNTNVVSTPRDPFVFNQDPGENSSQSPLQINHNCCYKCGDLLDGIFCQQCTCKSCGNGAHIGYNCPPKAPIISNPEQCNQTINELPQTLLSVHPTCNYEDKNSFTYDSKPNSFNDSPSVLTHPPQLQFETYLCELCGNNAHYGYDCPPQFPLLEEDFNGNIQAFLKEYDHIPPNEKCMALLLAEERFLKIKQVMREEQNQPKVMQELLLKLMDDLQILKGSQQEKKETATQSFIPYWDVSMIDDEEVRDNFLKDVCTFLRKFSRIPFGITPKGLIDKLGKVLAKLKMI
ncbi:hypothetical protein Tco_1008240 [Tanacetum coccineum]